MLYRQNARSELGVARLLRKAHMAHAKGALAQAEKFYKIILTRDPDNFDALHLLGFLNHQRGRSDQALRFLAAALKRNAQSAEALSNYGLVLHSLGRTEEALASYGAALAIQPDDADILNKYGIALLDLGRPSEALMSFDGALARNPAHIEALGNRGNCLLKLNKPEEAITCYDSARKIEGDSARLLTNRAHALRRLDRPEEALADLRTAAALDPNYAEAVFELGMVQLTLGDFKNGWAAYEHRWNTRAFAHYRRNFNSPLWTGEQPLEGRTILLHGEQGFGDTIQFVRYAAIVARLGATVILEVQPELESLVAEMEGVAHVIACGKTLVPFELHCPLMNLPRACATTLANIPVNLPYLKVPKAQAAKWASRLPDSKPLIGFAWAGRRSHHNDVNRSIELTRFASIFDLADFQFVSLQRDASAEDHALLCNYRNVIDFSNEFFDFVDTASLISQLDLVISVDTAVAHLAGALAKPVAVLLPFAADFRWLRMRDDSPWYPTARLFRQHRFDDWESVIEQVCEHLMRRRPINFVWK